MLKKCKKIVPGTFCCFVLAIPAWILGGRFEIIGGPVIAILLGMAIALFWGEKGIAEEGIKFTSKYVLQAAVVLLGFGLNLSVIFETGKQSLPIILCTIGISLLIAWAMSKAVTIPGNVATLIGVGSSMCGGSAVAATAPVIDAKDEEIDQSISVIFLFNVIAALIFPALGSFVGFDTTSGEAFGIFSGTAVNDTSSVTAAAATWDGMWGLGTETLDKAVTVKLTRTLAIIPITLGLAIYRARKEEHSNGFSIRKSFPIFILFFVLASVITTIALSQGVSATTFVPLKELSKFFITMAMGAIGLSCNVIELIKSGVKPILIGFCCWTGITVVTLIMQKIMGYL